MLDKVINLLRFRSVGLIARLSLIILAHTLTIIAGVWLLFFFPAVGGNQEDLAELNDRVVVFAESASAIISSSRDNTDRELRRLFLRAQESFDGVKRQALYVLDDSRDGMTPSIVQEWENDLESGVRITEAERLAKLDFVRVMDNAIRGNVVKIASDDFSEITCYTLVGAKADINSNHMYVYEIVLPSRAPIIGGWRFMYGLLAFFLSMGLIALLIMLLLQQKLSPPLVSLESAFDELAEGKFSQQVRVNVSPGWDKLLVRLAHGFNQMSQRLFDWRQELRETYQHLEETADELTDAKMFLETALETAPDAVIATDEQGEIRLFNKTGRTSFGYDADEPAPTGLGDLFVPNATGEFWRNHDLSGMATFESVGMRSDKSQFPAMVTVSPLMCANKNAVCGYLYVIKDISESEGFKDMMIRLDQLSVRSEMAGDIAHEINNYLAIIQGNAELLPILIGKGDQEKINKRLGLISSTVTRIASFAHGLMDFESGETRIAQEDLNQLIHNLMTFLKPQKRLAAVSVKFDAALNLPTVMVDSGMIQQAVVDLIYNAAESLTDLERPGEIVIETRLTDDNRILICVSDNGLGVPDDQREKLFAERFSTKRKGHGIGLLTCKKIAEIHAGTISYEPASLGGARFIINLPLRQSLETASATTTEITPEITPGLVNRPDDKSVKT